MNDLWQAEAITWVGSQYRNAVASGPRSDERA